MTFDAGRARAEEVDVKRDDGRRIDFAFLQYIHTLSSLRALALLSAPKKNKTPLPDSSYPSSNKRKYVPLKQRTRCKCGQVQKKKNRPSKHWDIAMIL